MCDWEVWRVGEHYRVPVAHGTWSGIEKQWVVLGPYHEDRELIGFEYDHFHLDPRFVPQHIWRRHVDDSASNGNIKAILGRPLTRAHEDAWGPPTFVGHRKMRMIRMVSPEAVRAVFESSRWMGELQECYDGSLRGTICPHRGGDLRGFAPDKHGCVTCVLHGLTWRVDPKAEDAGRLVSNATLPDWGSAWAGNLQQGGTI